MRQETFNLYCLPRSIHITLASFMLKSQCRVWVRFDDFPTPKWPALSGQCVDTDSRLWSIYLPSNICSVLSRALTRYTSSKKITQASNRFSTVYYNKLTHWCHEMWKFSLMIFFQFSSVLSPPLCCQPLLNIWKVRKWSLILDNKHLSWIWNYQFKICIARLPHKGGLEGRLG